jgi:hypothetical protein
MIWSGQHGQFALLRKADGRLNAKGRRGALAAPKPWLEPELYQYGAEVELSTVVQSAMSSFAAWRAATRFLDRARSRAEPYGRSKVVTSSRTAATLNSA